MKTDLFDTEVLPLFEKYREEWLDLARAQACKLGRGGSEVTIDDVRAICPPPPEVDPRVMGAVFRGGEWEAVGYRRSGRKQCHNRPIAIFKLRVD